MNTHQALYPVEQITKMSHQIVSEGYQKLHPLDRMKKLFDEHDENEILITSSFGTTSAVLLCLLSKVKPEHPVYFINTKYLFEETIAYKNKLADLYGLNVIEVYPDKNEHLITRHNKTWLTSPDLCCSINKVSPLEPLKRNHSIWISGLMGFQNKNRSELNIFEQGKEITKFYPLIDISTNELATLQEVFEIPEHPLKRQGYDSLGCQQCTKKGQGRSGRWSGSTKTECGLHL
ncbi:MAG: phosphoadenylyl-sulfate reductase [Bacteroidota bacterium]